jgi:hypothetical protein
MKSKSKSDSGSSMSNDYPDHMFPCARRLLHRTALRSAIAIVPSANHWFVAISLDRPTRPQSDGRDRGAFDHIAGTMLLREIDQAARQAGQNYTDGCRRACDAGFVKPEVAI